MTDTATAAPDSTTDEIDSKLAAADATAAEIQAEDAASADATPAEDATPEPPARLPGKVKSGADRRPRGWLETDVKRITDAFVQGEIVLEEGQHLTPHRLSRLVKDLDGLEEAPSTGACAAVLSRWEELGFAEVSKAPYAFKDYTEAGRTEGLTALKNARGENRKATRAAAKAALDAANPKPKRVSKKAAAAAAEAEAKDTEVPAESSAS